MIKNHTVCKCLMSCQPKANFVRKENLQTKIEIAKPNKFQTTDNIQPDANCSKYLLI